MNQEKLSRAWKSSKLAVLACIPAIVSGFLTYYETRSDAKEATQHVESKAEAGYQFTRAAYESMLKDIAELKAEVRLMRMFVLGRSEPLFGPPIVGDSAESSSPDNDQTSEIVVTSPKSDESVTITTGELPTSLDQAQRALK